MADIIRWGQSAYETDEDLAEERRNAADLGLTWAPHRPIDVTPDLSSARALVVTSKVRVTREVLAGFAGSLVLTTTSGYDHIDVDAARCQGVTVARCPDARRDPVVEHALGMALWLMRRSDALARAAEEGRWARAALPALAGRGLMGSRVLVVGLGHIGRRMAEVLTTLGADVIGVDPAGLPEAVSAARLPEDLADVDLVTLHCSLTPSSKGWLSDERLSHLSPHCVVVNTARGDVMDVEAAAKRVQQGTLRGVACDVFPVEPYPPLRETASVPGVVLSPHSAGYVHDLGSRVAKEVGRNLAAWVAGNPLPGAIP